jgi:hypothetical protein
MKAYSHSIVINSPINIVFKYISDDELIKKWNSSIIRNEYYKEEDKENKKTGLMFKQFIQVGREVIESKVTVLEYIPPNKIVGEATSLSYGNQKTSYELSEYNGHTKLTITSRTYYSNPFNRIVDFLFGWGQNILLKQMLNKLKRVIEEYSLIY